MPKIWLKTARVEHRRRGCSGTAGDHLESLRILQRSDLRGVPHEIYRHFGGRSSQPRKLGRVELRLLVGVERLERDRVLQETDDGAIPGRDVVGVVRGRKASSRGHVLRDDGGMPGN